MSEPESPVLRLIPYLAAITVTVFATLSVVGTGESNLLVTLVVAAVTYFAVYFIVKLIIHVLVTRIVSGSHGDED